MKKIKLIIVIVLTSIISHSCGDFLNVAPDNVPTIESAFSSKISAEKFLFTCYSYLPDFGSVRFDPAIAGSDEFVIHAENDLYKGLFNDFYGYRIKLGLQNSSEPLLNYWEGKMNAKNLFIGIRDCNIFLENIHRVIDLDEEDRKIWIAEVKFLKAYYHFYLLRMYGPIPLIKENIPVYATTEEARVYREPFDECVIYIAGLMDEAANDLPVDIANTAIDEGKITKSIALSVKAELLVLAASPLFNGNTDFANMVDKRGVKLFNPTHDQNKWKLAMDACKAAIDIIPQNKSLYVFNDQRYPVSDTTKIVMSSRNAFSVKWNSEMIWGMPKNTVYDLQHLSMPYFNTTDQRLTPTTPILAPAMNMVEMFYSENGVPINEDPAYNYDNRYATSIAKKQRFYIGEDFETANVNQHREPRFYANLGFDGGVWFGNGRFKDVGQGSFFETSWVVNAKSGQISGKTSAVRYSATGYFIKKYSNFETVTNSTGIVYTRYNFPIMRLASLYLYYAEARNEFVGPDPETYKYIDLVRERAGLKGVVESWANHSIYSDKPTTKAGMREIIQRERMIEMAFEGSRFWDIRRWKKANEVLNNPIQGWNVNESTTVDYYNLITLGQYPFSTKEYLWPLSELALRQNPNLVQNPIWSN